MEIVSKKEWDQAALNLNWEKKHEAELDFWI